MAVKLITDSGCDLTWKQAQELNVILVPMTVRFGTEEYFSGIDLKNEDFYKKLAASTELPTTSQPTPFQFEQVYKTIKENGDEAVVLCVSSALSGTYQSATIAQDGFEDFVYVVDSQAVSTAQKILLDYAISLRNHGASAQEIAQALNEKKADVCAFAAVETLEYLIKGGRLSKAAGAVGSVLGIRPILTLKEGALAIAGKARGSKSAVSMTNKMIAEAGIDFSMPVGVGYTGCDPDVIRPFLDAEDSVFSCEVPSVYHVGSTVGTHAGPGLYIAAFFKKS